MYIVYYVPPWQSFCPPWAFDWKYRICIVLVNGTREVNLTRLCYTVGSASIARRIKLRYRLLSYDNGKHYELLTVGNYKTKKKKKSEIPKGTITWPIKAIKLMLILN
jgi:hypothetical protein